MNKTVYIAATSQNDGKTTISIGLLNKLMEHYKSVGFIKPVGQQYVDIKRNKIDKDVALMHSIYNFGDELKDMSPIAIPRGFTEKYLMNRKKQRSVLKQKVLNAYTKISKDKEMMVIEGTGHAGVGSIFDLNNAQAAKLLNAKVILICKGGIGRPIDEIYMNKILFEKENIEIIGVIANHVYEKKYYKTKKLFKMALDNIGLKFLGVIPECKTLSNPTMYQIKEHLDAELINGDYLYENIVQIVVGAMVPHHALSYIKKGTVMITPGDREDLILASLSTKIEEKDDKNCISGLILTEGIKPHKNIYEVIKKTNIPVISVKEETYQTASKVHDLLVKIMYQDKQKIELAKRLISKYVNINYIVEHL